MAGYHSHQGRGSQMNCKNIHTGECEELLVRLHLSPERHAAITYHWHVPEAFARVSLLERRALGVELLSSSCGGGNHHFLISRCTYTHIHTHTRISMIKITGKRSLVIKGSTMQKATIRACVRGWCWLISVCVCRTARDAGVHLSKAWVSLLGEQSLCLVDVLPCLMDSTADAGHRHLREGGREGVPGGGRGRMGEGVGDVWDYLFLVIKNARQTTQAAHTQVKPIPSTFSS